LKPLESIQKYTTICLITLILTIPLFFGFYAEYLFISEFSLYTLFIFLGGLLVLLSIGELIDMFGFTKDSLDIIKKHDVIDVLIEKRNRLPIFSLFLITMIMEELIFRNYLINLFIRTVKLQTILGIFISSLTFSLYHIHTWFYYKDLRISVIYLINSFLLGLFNGYIFLTLGLITCIIIHTSLAFLFYYNLYKRYFKKEKI
jgi:membrane protease YdiL (CAAX protease family)